MRTPHRRTGTRDRGSPTSGMRLVPGAIGRSSLAYRSHPMGRSLAPVDRHGGRPAGRCWGGTADRAQGGAVYDRAPRRPRVSQGGASRRRREASAEIEAEVRFALGSGTRGISFLIERDGFLFQSPIAWFAQKRRWDISPGYGEFSARPNFERAIQPDCLFCHANQFRAVAGTLNRYEKPIFQGHAIGCERCHGPGELHVRTCRAVGRVRLDHRQPGSSSARRYGIRSVSNAISRARSASPARAASCSTTARACRSTGSWRFFS